MSFEDKEMAYIIHRFRAKPSSNKRLQFLKPQGAQYDLRP